MWTQCPHCSNKQDVPDSYVQAEIKCTKCHKSFVAQPLKTIARLKERSRPKRTVPRVLRLPGSLLFDVIAGIGAFISIIGILVSFALLSVSAIAGFFVALLLSFVLAGIAAVIEAVNANTRRREEKK